MLMYLILKQQSSNYNSTVSRRKLVYLFIFLPVPIRQQQQCLLRHKLQISGLFPLVCTNHANKPFPISYSKPTWDLKDCISGPFFTMFFVGFPGDFQRAIWAIDSSVFLRLVRAHNWARWEYQAIFGFCSMKNVSKLYVLNYFFTLVLT